MRRYSIIALIILSGCATPEPIDVTVKCIPLTKYTMGDNLAYGNELKVLQAEGKYPTVLRFLGDYFVTRQAIRACQAGGKPSNQ